MGLEPNGASRSSFPSLAALGGILATAAAVALGAVLAVFAAATVVVIALLSSVLLALAALAFRARKAVRSRTRRDDGVIEARQVGGHHWVAYGWNERP
jgi:hypothetical protein